MSLRDELIQVAAVAIAIVTDLDQGDTNMHLGDQQNTGHQRVMGDVLNERIDQEIRWGLQHHPVAEWLSILGEEYGEACKAANDEIIFPKGGER